MRAIGIKQLKARLSELLRLVKKGETILVTERDEVVAELRPARRGALLPDTPEALLDGLADTGEVTLPVLPKRGWKWRPRSLGLPEGTARKILDDIRQDR